MCIGSLVFGTQALTVCNLNVESSFRIGSSLLCKTYMQWNWFFCMDSEAEIEQKKKALRGRFEQHILDNFDGQEVWYQEKKVQLIGEAKILADDWGIHVNFESLDGEAFSVSGRWDYLVVFADRLGAVYSGWSLTTFCPYPEWND